MDKLQEAYVKGVAHSIEVHAQIIRQGMEALQRNSLRDMPVELLELNFREATESCRHIQNILSELLPNLPNNESVQVSGECAVCQEPNGPFIRVEVSDDGEHFQWFNACSDDCLKEITLRWKQTSEIIRPGDRR